MVGIYSSLVVVVFVVVVVVVVVLVVVVAAASVVVLVAGRVVSGFDGDLTSKSAACKSFHVLQKNIQLQISA